MEAVKWVVAHWEEITEVIAYIIAIASIIVKLTPNLADDAFMKKVIRFVGRYIALNR